MKKKKYSLSAKERKELRKQEELKKQKKAIKNGEVVDFYPEENVDGAVAVATKPNKKSFIILIIAIVLGVILIVSAILIPFLIKGDTKYATAVITLEDNRKINLLIWEENHPITATNFMFLAKIGYFDGTIFYDAQNNFANSSGEELPSTQFVRFGNYKSYSDLRSKDANFIASVSEEMFDLTKVENKNFTVNSSKRKNMFGYRLHSDKSNEKNRYKERGIVSFVNKNSSDFLINLLDGCTQWTAKNEQYSATSSENLESNLRAFGEVADDESFAVLDSILNTKKDKNTNGYFVGTDPVIRIKNVKVQSNNRAKWKKFEFVTYMNKANGENSAFSQWHAVS